MKIKIISFLIFFMLMFIAWGNDTEKPMNEKNVTIEMIDMDSDGATALDVPAVDNQFSNQESKLIGDVITLEADLISNEIVPIGLIPQGVIEIIDLQFKLPYLNLSLNPLSCDRGRIKNVHSNHNDQFDFG